MSPHKLVVLLVTALAISAGSIVQGGDQPRPVASIYNGNAGVLDLKWDDGPKNVRKQFELLGIDVHEATAPDTVGLSSVFVIPAQNGPVMYAAAEDMSVVASFVAAGGLVIILDGQDGGDASLKSFVSQALGYSGDWSICKRFSDNTRTKIGEPQRSTFATTFLGDASSWPETLEEAPIISVRSWCAHTDPQAVSWPLYNLDGDDMQATAQAFSKVGTSGAVVWLGYTWKGGAQKAWGHLLDRLIRDFGTGAFHTPTAGTRAEMESAYPLRLTSAVHPHEQQFFVEEQPVDTLLFTASDMSTDSMDVVRRMMQTGGSFGAYPSPPAAEPPTPPPGLALPPAPPGFSIKIEDYNAFFKVTIDVDDPVQLGDFLTDFRTKVATALGVPIDQVIIIAAFRAPASSSSRRLVEDMAQRVWTARQLAEDSFGLSSLGITRLVHIRTYSADEGTLAELHAMDFLENLLSRAASHASTVSPTRRLLAEDDQLCVNFIIASSERSRSPPPSPPLPPRAPGWTEPPAPPPAPPAGPPDAPPRPQINLVELARVTGAESFTVGFPPPSPAPSPAPLPPAPPSPPVPRRNRTSVRFTNLLAQGALGKTGRVVWYDDPYFENQRTKVWNSPLNLVKPNRKPCPTDKPGGCARAWRPKPKSFSVTVFFREPVQLDAVRIRQILNPNITEVRFLRFPAVDISTRIPSSVFLGDAVFPTPALAASTQQTAPGWFNIPIPLEVSKTDLAVKVVGNQQRIQPNLRDSVVGGVVITVRTTEKPRKGAWIEDVRFDGRVLYPRNLGAYAV